jgi:hypothetical protein
LIIRFAASVHGCPHALSDNTVLAVGLFLSNLLLSVFQFEFFNSFTSLFYIAFYLQDMDNLKQVQTLPPSPPSSPRCHHVPGPSHPTITTIVTAGATMHAAHPIPPSPPSSPPAPPCTRPIPSHHRHCRRHDAPGQSHPTIVTAGATMHPAIPDPFDLHSKLVCSRPLQIY